MAVFGYRGLGAVLDRSAFAAATHAQDGSTFWNDDVASSQLARIRQIKTGQSSVSSQNRLMMFLSGGGEDVGAWISAQLAAGKCIVANVGVVFPDAIGTVDSGGFEISNYLIAVEYPFSPVVAQATSRSPVLVCSQLSAASGKSWWGDGTSAQKAAMIIGSVAIIGAIGYFISSEGLVD
jgi:hypothetical protein